MSAAAGSGDRSPENQLPAVTNSSTVFSSSSAAVDINLRLHDSSTDVPQPADGHVEGLGHRNTASERDEAAMAALGSLPQPQRVGPESTTASPSPKPLPPLTVEDAANGQTTAGATCFHPQFSDRACVCMISLENI